MTQQFINTGTIAGDHTGDSLRTAGLKINANFTEIYGTLAQNSFPIQTNNAGKVLITNGTALSWQQLSSIASGNFSVSIDTSGNLNLPSNLILNGGNAALTITSATALTVPTLKFADASQQSTAYLGTATTSQIGGVKPDGSTITISNGVISAVPGSYVLPTASLTTLGGVKVDGSTVTISNGVITSHTNYSLPTSTTSVLGGVKIDGSTITISNGVISATPYSLPTATAGTISTGTLGGVKVDGTSIAINNGVISTGVLTSSQVTSALGFTPYNATNPNNYIALPALSVTNASASSTASLAYNNSTGVFTFTPATAYVLPTANIATLGGVKVDGTSIIIASGVISVPAIATIGQNSGIATLDSTGRLTASQIPTSLTGAVIFKGTWNATTNNPTLTNGTGTTGWEYAVSVGGTINLGAGNITFNAGDYVIYNGTAWQQIPGGATTTANSLSGTTLAANVVNSSLTSVGILTNLTVTNTIVGNISGNAATVTSISGNSLTIGQITGALGYTPLSTNSLSIITNGASGNGSLSYLNNVFTFTPPAPYSLPTASALVLGGVKVDGTSITINGGIISATPYSLPTATTGVLGGVKVDGSTITINNGVISSVGGYTLPTATTSVLGGVKVDGSTISITNGIISANYTNYTLPTATTNILGGVKVDGTTITISNGVISSASAYSLPTATTSILGGVKVDGTTITINGGGVISSAQYTLPTASTTVSGGIKIDGSTLTFNGSGQLVANYTNYSLPTATTGVLGGVKVDGSTITISNGVISSVQPTGLQSRSTVQVITGSLAYQSYTLTNTAMAKGYVLYSIQVNAGAWVTVYTSSTAQSNDASRAITTDPTPGSGVVAEAITTTATTTYFTPAVYGYNADPSISSTTYLKVYNNSGSSNTITVTLTYLKLEV